MNDIFATLLLLFFVVGFVALGFLFLRKKRAERIAILSTYVDQQATPEPLARALVATRNSLIGRLGQLMSGGVNEGVLQQLEAALIGADVGVKTSERLLLAIRKHASSSESALLALKGEMMGVLQARPLTLPSPTRGEGSPFVVLFVGVNGVGKTTTIGKIAAQLVGQGKKVLLGAGDTFRAAASEQLAICADRVGVPIVARGEGADPSAVLFDAVRKAQNEGFDVVLCDTAGRLHTKNNLMDELRKMHKVLGKARENAPDEVLLVLDATQGQNAIQQAKQFAAAVPLSGIILTKLDGTAKGGVIFGIVHETGVPVLYIGVGEGVQDLRPFDPGAFVDALFESA